MAPPIGTTLNQSEKMEFKIMLRTTYTVAGSFLLATALTLSGCGKSATPTASPQKTGQADATPAVQEAKVTAALAELSAEDRAIAVKQKVCPVTGVTLGGMGAPVKVDVKGQPVFICCDACREELLAQPDKYLAKLNK